MMIVLSARFLSLKSMQTSDTRPKPSEIARPSLSPSSVGL